MIIDVMPGLTRLLAGHLPTGSTFARGLVLTGACVTGALAACAVRTSGRKRPRRRAGGPT